MMKAMKKGQKAFHTMNISLQSKLMSLLLVRMARLMTGARNNSAQSAR